MGRRSNVNNRKQSLKKGDHKRDKNKIDKKSVIILACEGSKTEKNYFKAFFDYLIRTGNLSPRSYVFANHQHTHPTGVLNDLLHYKGTDGLTYKDFDNKWIVIDRDEERLKGEGHSLQDFNNAILASQSKNISVAYSNPCFEIWYLLHFNYYDSSIDRDTAYSKLENIMKNYKKGDKSHFTNLFDNLDTAIINAKKLDDTSALDIYNAQKNPITTVYKIIEKFYKKPTV